MASLIHELSEQQLRIYVCQCCRRIWNLLIDERSRIAVEVAERFALSAASSEDLALAHKNAWNAYVERSQTIDDHAAAAAYYCASPALQMLQAATNRVLAAVDVKDVELAAQADLLRGILGNPCNNNDAI